MEKLPASSRKYVSSDTMSEDINGGGSIQVSPLIQEQTITRTNSNMSKMP